MSAESVFPDLSPWLSGSPWDKEIPIGDVKKVVEAYLNVGITEISLSDAAGVAFPSQVYDMGQEMKREYPQVKWWLPLPQHTWTWNRKYPCQEWKLDLQILMQVLQGLVAAHLCRELPEMLLQKMFFICAVR